MQIIVQVAIKAARPTMDASTPEPLKRLIAKCWAQVYLLLVQSSAHLVGFRCTQSRLVRCLLKIRVCWGSFGQAGMAAAGSPGAPQLLRDHAPDRDPACPSQAAQPGHLDLLGHRSCCPGFFSLISHICAPTCTSVLNVHCIWIMFQCEVLQGPAQLQGAIQHLRETCACFGQCEQPSSVDW